MPKYNTYEDIKSDAARKPNTKNDCSVITLALTTGVSYKDAETALRRCGRKNNDGATMQQIEDAYEMLGFKLVKRNDELVELTTAVQAKLSWQNITNFITKHVQRFPELNWSNKTQLWEAPGHVLTYMNGQVEDWSEQRGVAITGIYDVELA